MTDAQIAAFIRTNLRLHDVPGRPELELHRAHPASGLRRLTERDACGAASPYWAYPWPGGLGLARHLLDRPEAVRGRRVLDLGSGSGLVAIAAAKAGAADVMAAETDRHARIAIGLNAEANDVRVAIIGEDLLARPPPAVDVVLVGDLFYERGLARRVAAFLARCRIAGREVLVGDIGRAFLPMSRLRRVADYPVVEFGAADGSDRKLCTIFSFEAGVPRLACRKA